MDRKPSIDGRNYVLTYKLLPSTFIDSVDEDLRLRKMTFVPLKITSVNPFPNKLWFSRVCSISLGKTVGKGEIAH